MPAPERPSGSQIYFYGSFELDAGKTATFHNKNILYLLADGSRHGYWEGPDDASSQVLSFPLLTELTQLLLLLLIQGVTVMGLADTQMSRARRY